MARKKAAAAKAVEKNMEAETVAVKKSETKTGAEAVKETETKTAEKKASEKSAARKTPVKENIYVQFMGNEVSMADIMKKVKENWTKVLKNKVGDMKSVTLYVKPEEGKAYYVINEEVKGAVEL